MSKPGRPRKPVVDPATLEVLTIPEALAYMRSLGRGLSRRTLMDAILAERLPALIDELRHDRFGHPLLSVRRLDLNTWLASTLRPLVIQGLGSVRKIS